MRSKQEEILKATKIHISGSHIRLIGLPYKDPLVGFIEHQTLDNPDDESSATTIGLRVTFMSSVSDAEDREDEFKYSAPEPIHKAVKEFLKNVSDRTNIVARLVKTRHIDPFHLENSLCPSEDLDKELKRVLHNNLLDLDEMDPQLLAAQKREASTGAVPHSPPSQNQIAVDSFKSLLGVQNPSAEQFKILEEFMKPTPGGSVSINAGFGCGKTSTAAAAALATIETKGDTTVVFLAETNFATAAFVTFVEQSGSFERVRPLYLPSNQFSMSPDYPHSRFALEQVMKRVFAGEISRILADPQIKHLSEARYEGTEQQRLDLIAMYKYVRKRDREYRKRLSYLLSCSTKYNNEEYINLLFRLYRPNLVVSTTGMANRYYGLFSPYPSFVIIDEISLISGPTLLALRCKFFDWSIKSEWMLLGDNAQIGPYSTISYLTPIMGVSSAKGLANVKELSLSSVFRCHPAVTELVSRLFYDDKLAVADSRRSQEEISFKPAAREATFLPRDASGLKFNLNNWKALHNCGSWCNTREARYIIECISELPKIWSSNFANVNIAIITPYSSQSSELTRLAEQHPVVSRWIDESGASPLVDGNRFFLRISTIRRYQGKESHVVFVSLVKGLSERTHATTAGISLHVDLQTCLSSLTRAKFFTSIFMSETLATYKGLWREIYQSVQ